MSISERYVNEQHKVEAQCKNVGRSPHEVRLIAVSKTVDEQGVAEAYEAGARDFGENRPDQLIAKAPLFPEARWHFIGNIQSRRIHDIVSYAYLIHSLYQLHHAEKIDREAAKIGKVQDVLIEVNVSGETSKSGVNPEDACTLALKVAMLENVRLCGLMTMAPIDDPDVARQTFQGLAKLACQIKTALPETCAASFTELSMGMSDDWRIAIGQGATMVRIGRAIFSDTYCEA